MANGPTNRDELSPGAATGLTFAACMMFVIGVFGIIAGLAAVINDDFFDAVRHYAFDVDISAWGWIHILLGALLILTSIGLFMRQGWAVITAIFLASLSAIANFFFIPYYPVWAILVIAIDVWIIWSLTRPGTIRD